MAFISMAVRSSGQPAKNRKSRPRFIMTSFRLFSWTIPILNLFWRTLSSDRKNNKSLILPLRSEALYNLKLKNLLQLNVFFFVLPLKMFVHKLSRFFKLVTHTLRSPKLGSSWNVLREPAGTHFISRPAFWNQEFMKLNLCNACYQISLRLPTNWAEQDLSHRSQKRKSAC